MRFQSRAVWSVVGALVVLALGPQLGVEAQSTGGQLPRQVKVRPDEQPVAWQMQMTPQRLAALEEGRRGGLGFAPGEVLVKFKPGVTVAGQQRALMALRSRPDVDRLRWIGDVAVLNDATQPDARVLAAQLSEQPEVVYAEPNYLLQIDPQPAPHQVPLGIGVGPNLVPNDPSFGLRQWNLQAIGMPSAWDINGGSDPSIIVAVIDSGVTTVNQSFTMPLWTGSAFQTVTVPAAINTDIDPSRITSPIDFTFSLPGGPVVDMVGHGTHVASTIAESTNNALALAGVAFRARLMPVKVCTGYWEFMFARAQAGIPGFPTDNGDFCFYSEIAAGIRYAADSGANVINISLGGSAPSQTIRDALVYAVSRGAFVSISMGNEFEDGNPIGYPAFYADTIDGVMSVAALGRSLTRSYFSSTGAHAEIAAPGGSIRDGGFSGLVYQSTLVLSDISSQRSVPRFDRYVETGYQGTSMAAPHVAGTAALIMSQMPGVTPAIVERIIRMTARACSSTSCVSGTVGANGRTPQFGFGIIQPRAALFGRGVR